MLAVPRRPKQSQGQKGCEGGGQENVNVMVGGRDGNDFEEAGFLVGYGSAERMEVE